MPDNQSLPDSQIMAKTQAQIEQLFTQWMIGQQQPLNMADIPEAFVPIIEALPNEKRSRAMLALLSQYHSVMYQPALNPSGQNQSKANITPYPLLPVLPLPILSQQNGRSLCKRILADASKSEQALILKLLSNRGYSVHPADWLPKASYAQWDDSLPAMYFPWCLWVANQLKEKEKEEMDVITEDNWDEWYPAQRLIALRHLRRHEPDEARELIKKCVAKESADKRVKIIDVLAIHLTLADTDYLISLQTDRSQKVVTLAKHLLIRLGVYETEQISENQASEIKDASEELANELASNYNLEISNVEKTGTKNKTLKINPKRLKSDKQKAIRTEQLAKVNINTFIQALEVDMESFINGWSFVKNRDSDNDNLVENLANTLADKWIKPLVNKLVHYVNSSNLYLLHHLLPRLDDEDKIKIMLDLLSMASADISFDECLTFLKQPLNDLDYSTLQTTKAWKELIKNIKKALKDNSYMVDYHIEHECKALGHILPQKTAIKVLEELCGMGMFKADPVLDVLRLNAELTANKT